MNRVDGALSLVRKHGITHEVSLIFGLPTQTVESFEQSVEFCLRNRVPVIRAFPLMVLRGTPLEADRSRWSLVESAGPMPVVISSNSFDVADWEYMAGLSDALKLTEGAHPRTIAQLRRLARPVRSRSPRWQPTPTNAANKR